MQQSVNERVKFLVDNLCEGNVSRFAKEIGVSHTSINTLMPGDRGSKPGFETIAKISTRYPEVNIDWLITGQGEPFKDSPGTMSGINSAKAGTFNNVGTSRNKISVGSVKTPPESSDMEYYRNRVRELENTIDKLHNKIWQLLERKE